MGITVNVSDEDRTENEAAKSNLIPTGKYNFQIIDAEQDTYGPNSKNKGKPYLNLTLRVADGDFAGRQLKFVGVPLFLKWNNEKKTPTSFLDFFTSITDDEGARAYAERNPETDEFEISGEFEVPEEGELLEKFVVARVRIEDNEYNGEVTKKNSIAPLPGSFFPYDPTDDPSPTREAAATAAAAPAKGGSKAKKAPAKKGSLDL